ncbi:MAG: PIN domain-containing protein [Nitrospirae bacterium]|nr:PIN domain-containing protein [Nitrospirota bacterium]
MEVKRWRVFLDTSALIAGIVSPTGAAREVLRLAEARLIHLVVSRQALTEADRNLAAKLPVLLPEYSALLRAFDPLVVEDPDRAAVREATKVIHHKDAPILAAALAAHVDYLVSWNTRHFQTSAVRRFVPFPIVTPGEFLQAFRSLLPNL